MGWYHILYAWEKAPSTSLGHREGAPCWEPVVLGGGGDAELSFPGAHGAPAVWLQFVMSWGWIWRRGGVVKEMVPTLHASLLPQVMYFSSLFPYVVLVCFLVRGLLLRGAVDGIMHMFTPKVRAQRTPSRFILWAAHPLCTSFHRILSLPCFHPKDQSISLKGPNK